MGKPNFNLKQIVKNRVDVFGEQYLNFGIFGAINYPLFYIIWLYLAFQTYESFFLRLIATLLCIPLIFHKYWPRKLKSWLPLYWYTTLVYCLPFFFTYMLLRNNASDVWLMSTTIVMLWLMLLVDSLSFLILLGIGTLAAWVAFTFTSTVPFHKIGWLGLVLQYFGSLAVVLIFARRKERFYERKMRLKAEASSQAKSQFIANMSHDLRTPMTGISGMLDALSYLAKDAEMVLANNPPLEKLEDTLRHTIARSSEYTRHAKEASQDLLHLFNQILEAVQLESGKVEMSLPGAFDIELITKRSIKLLRPIANEKDLQLSYTINPALPRSLIGMSVFIERVLSNLIGNAIKFTKTGGVNVNITLDDVKGDIIRKGQINLIIQVKDTGIGIPPEKYKAIFEYFTRLSPSYEGVYKGSGLGLYIVNRYVELMHGKIDLKSELGEGTCFTVKIPLAVSPARIRQEKPLSRTFQNTSTVSHDPLEVLIVEDSVPAAMAVKITLERLNCRVDVAKCGNEALQKAAAKTYKLIFMDVGLPDFNGIEAARKIRSLENKARSQTPIIGLTGHADNNNQYQACLEAGMQEVMNKPAEPAELDSVLQRWAGVADSKSSQSNNSTPKADQLASIDWEGCVAACANKKEVARDLLNLLIDDLTQKTLPRVEEAYKKQDNERLSNELHRSLGGVVYLRLPRLENALRDFYSAVSSEPQKHEAISRGYREFMHAVKEFFSASRSFI